MIPTVRRENDDRPRFEYYPASSPTLRTVYVEKLPFTIGRGDGTGLQINSTSVSREHAVLSQTPAGYRLKDLQSTNGTSVNGEQVTEADLHDGDSISIADVKLTFICSSMGRLQRMVTQPLIAQQESAPAIRLADAILAHRTVSEALLWQTVPLHWSSFVESGSEKSLAHISEIAEPLASQLAPLDSDNPVAVSNRLQMLAWQVAAQGMQHSEDHGCLLFRVQRQSSFRDQLIDWLELTRQWLPHGSVVGVLVPWECATNSPNSIKLCSELRSWGATLAFDDFSGGAGCVEAMELAPPDYMIMAPHVLRGVSEQARRLQRLEIVQASCEAAGIRTVLPCDISAEDESACRQLGIETSLVDSAESHNLELAAAEV